MKTLMIPKRLWKEARGYCAGNSERSLDPDRLVGELSTLSSRNAAVGLISSMRALGLVDGSNHLTGLGVSWSNDITYAEACRKIAEASFPVETREAIAANAGSNEDVVKRYAELEGMNIAGARKNVRLLRMLIDDSSSPRPESGRARAVGAGAGSGRAPGRRGASGGKPRGAGQGAADGIPSTSFASTRAQLGLTVPLERLSDVLVAIYSVVDPDETPASVQIV